MSCIRAPSLSGGPLKTGKGKEMNRRVLSMVLCVCLLGLTLPALSEEEYAEYDANSLAVAE